MLYVYDNDIEKNLKNIYSLEVNIMKNLVKWLTVIIFISLLIFMYFYFQREEANERSDEQLLDEEESYDNYLDNLEQPLDTRLTYEKEMLFVYVQEMNNFALKEIPLDDLVVDEISFNEETEAIYFYNENNIPQSSTELIVLYEAYNLDFLLLQDINYSTNASERIQFTDILFSDIDDEFQPVNNENRLFLDEAIAIEQVGETDTVRVEFNEQSFELKRGEYKDFILEKDDKKSRILIRNFGHWETVNMKYEITE